MKHLLLIFGALLALAGDTFAAGSFIPATVKSNFTTVAAGYVSAGSVMVTNNLKLLGTLNGSSLGSNAVVSLIGRTAAGQIVETSTGIDPAYIRGLIVTRSSASAIAVSAGSWYHNVSNRVYALPASTLTVSGLAASTMYSVYASVSNSAVVLEAFAENPPTTNYFGTARQRASGTLGRWIGHFITNPAAGVAATVTKETGVGTVTAIYLDPTLTATRLVSAGTATSFTLVSADPVCPKYTSTEMLAIFWPSYSTTGGAQIVMGTSMDGNQVFAQYSGYCSAINTYINTLASHPLNDSNAIYYRLTGIAPGVGANTYIDVSGVKYSR